MAANACPLCTMRKARRACPALDRAICPTCCGTKRLTEIACPPTCAYLSSARTHPPAVALRRQERDLQFLLPMVGDLSEPQMGLFLMFQAVAVEHARAALPPVYDEDVANAAAAAASTLETSQRGIIYEHQAPSLPAERLKAAMTAALTDVPRDDGAAARRLERDAAVALRRLERGARTAETALVGDDPPIFLKLLGRLAENMRGSQAGTAGEPGVEAPEAPRSRLIIPR